MDTPQSIFTSPERQFEYRYVFYRLAKWVRNPFVSGDLIPVWGDYFIDLWPYSVPLFVENLQTAQNQTPRAKMRFWRFRFYSRWLDPVFVPLARWALRSQMERQSVILWGAGPGQTCHREETVETKPNNQNISPE